MAINVQHGPNMLDYGLALAGAAQNIETNRRELDKGELAMRLKAQSDALRSQVVQRGVAGGGGAQIGYSDPSGISNPGSNLSTGSMFQLQQAPPQRQSAPQQQYQPSQQGGSFQFGAPATPQSSMIYNPQTVGGYLGALTQASQAPMGSYGATQPNPMTGYYKSALGL